MRVSVSTHAQRRIDSSTREGDAKHSAADGMGLQRCATFKGA